MHQYHWLHDADAAYAAMEALIDGARTELAFEGYIFRDGACATRLVEALLRAAARGVRVRVLLDALGSDGPDAPWLAPLAPAGIGLRWFNPRRGLLRYACRDHRKLVVADGARALLGGFNVADEFAGDGIARGWRDLGLAIEGPAVATLLQSFDLLFRSAAFGRRDWRRLLRAERLRGPGGGSVRVLLGGPGRSQAHLRRALRTDMRHATRIDVMAAYFMPTGRLRRALQARARAGHVRLLLAGPTDVPLARLAARSLYERLLRAGVRLWEYQPQVLHAKAIALDDVVYVGSANLDARSLQLNFELMLRIDDATLAAQLRARFAADLERSHEVQASELVRAGPWQRALQALARALVARLDPWLSLTALRRLL